MTTLPAGWPSSKPDGRTITQPGASTAGELPGSWSPIYAYEHVQGRIDSTAQILLGVAVLKSKGHIWNYVVGHTGAVWQDRKGTTALSNRAHCVPCNPTITNQNIPDIAPTHGLRNALIAPLAKTDFLNKIVNHCDSRFEALGAADSFANAVRLTAREQERGKPVSYDLFFHALQGLAVAGYRAAYQRVYTEAMDALNGETSIGLQQRTEAYSVRRPKTNLEAIVETAEDLNIATAAVSTRFASQGGFDGEVTRLGALADGTDLIRKALNSRV